MLLVSAVLGATVPIGLESLPAKLQPDYSPLAKTKFSMVLPQVVDSLKQWNTQSVVLIGIEASRSATVTSPCSPDVAR